MAVVTDFVYVITASVPEHTLNTRQEDFNESKK